MFEVMTRQLLSDSIPEGDMDAAVEYLSRVSWAGWRPDLPPSLPKELRLLISLCWHREPRLRPSFPTIATRLREVLLATAAVPSRASKSSLVAAAPPPPGPQLQQQQEQLAFPPCCPSKPRTGSVRRRPRPYIFPHAGSAPP
ncbi:hypothetical protein PLESTB_000008800 [Pleodorina starrii]|uniref:Serine-threonine/tyrosine-protein kinase catalytic domain-containing protein n=1 Tax=Pleodorina starrii TaxID=330485 RepID=A0A9W6B872_9CHLO|nr:hypothetical protein PLESTM_000838400 [Pleodorina starrii]GLC47629.1 hypothetical protein PLESTB_000008800 [Pleodorina starrii]GLC75638.1 hypothetical protein PLESTF_001667900 [Pleodorina starrii]